MANSQKGKIDMTTGHIMRNIILFAIPIIIGNVLQQLYTTVDALVIGKYCGDTSLAAVGTSSQPVEVLLCVFLGIGTGVSILISQYTGARESGKVVSVCGTSITFIYIIGIPIGILGWFAVPYILEFMKVPQDVWNAALIYTRVVFLGTLGNLGYNMNAGILRGLGDSKASLWFLVVSCVSNIVFDLLFVAGFGMDVAGAALSTSIAMFISWIVSIVYIRKKFPERALKIFCFFTRHHSTAHWSSRTSTTWCTITLLITHVIFPPFPLLIPIPLRITVTVQSADILHNPVIILHEYLFRQSYLHPIQESGRHVKWY